MIRNNGGLFQWKLLHDVTQVTWWLKGFYPWVLPLWIRRRLRSRSHCRCEVVLLGKIIQVSSGERRLKMQVRQAKDRKDALNQGCKLVAKPGQQSGLCGPHGVCSLWCFNPGLACSIDHNFYHFFFLLSSATYLISECTVEFLCSFHIYCLIYAHNNFVPTIDFPIFSWAFWTGHWVQ